MSAKFPSILRWYLWALMGGLLLQGLGSLIFRLSPAIAAAAPYLLRGVLGIDFWHAWIHILWGLVGVGILVGRYADRTAVRLALIFGLFYTLLGFAGVVFHHPLGLELDVFENVFHLTAGPATLLLGLLGMSARARIRSLVGVR
jgi:hypothetical protein